MKKSLYPTLSFLKTSTRYVLLSAFALLWGNTMWAQTNPPAQSLPYSQNFGTTTFTAMPTGWAAWNGLNGGSITTQALAEASVPTGNATVTAAVVAQTTGGVYGFATSSNGRAYVQTSGNDGNGVNQLALAINTTGKSNIVVKYDVEIINAQTRTVGIVMQYRVGTSGAWTTVPSATGNPYSQSGGTVGVKANVILTLPSGANNQSVVQLRWAIWRGTEAGASSGIAIDNVTVCEAPTANAGPDQLTCVDGVVRMAGSVGGSATGGTWSDGGLGGTFLPNANNLNAFYIPPTGNTDTISLVLTTTGGCPPQATDTMRIAYGSLPPMTLRAVAPASVTCGENVTISIEVDGFVDIKSYQFALEWDPAIFDYVGYSATVIGGVEGTVGEFDVANGILTYGWVDPAGIPGENLADETVVLTVTLKALVNTATDEPVNIIGTIVTPIEATNSQLCFLTVNVENEAEIDIEPITVQCPANFAVCVYDVPFALSGGTPDGGDFSGNGVTNNEFDPAAANIGANTITYSYTDNNGCSNSCEFTITVNAQPTVTCPLDQIVCEDELPLDLTTLGALPAGGSFSGTGVTGTSYNAAGGTTNTVTYTYNDGNCENSCTFDITVNTNPACNITGLDIVCANSEDNLYEAPTGMTSYQWSITGNGTIDGPDDEETVLVDAGAVGSYELLLTITDANGCTSTCTKTVTVAPPPTLTLTVDAPANATCGDIVDITIEVSNSFTNISSLQFSVEWDEAKLMYQSYVAPEIGGTGGDPFVGDLDAVTNGELTFTWFDPDPNAEFDGVDLSDGTVILTLTMKVIGSTGSVAVSVTDNPEPREVVDANFCSNTVTSVDASIALSPITVTCPSNTTVCIDEASFGLTGGTPSGGTYTGPGVSANTFDPAAAGPGTHAITYSYTDAMGCSNSCTFDITVEDGLPTADAGNGGDECDLTFSLNAVPSVGTGAWTYSGPGTASFDPDVNTATAIVTVTDYGTYTFTWTETNGACTDDDDVTVNFYEQPIVSDQLNQAQCANGDFTMTQSAPSVGTGVWTVESGTATITDDADPTTTVTGVPVGTSATVRWTVTNGTCSVFDEVTLTNDEQPVANAGNGGDECDLTFSLNAVPSVGTGTWTYAGPGTATFAPDANDPAATATVTAYGAYTFTWTEVNGTCTDADDVTVNFYEQPVANAGNGGDECDLTFSLNAVPSVGTGTWTYAGPGTATFAPDANDPDATATVTAYGTYTFTWTEVNGTCTDADDVTVNFYEQPVANAGNGGDECDLTFSLNAVPSVGTGTWTYAGPGTATFAPDANDPAATATVTAYGAYTFTWTEVNGICTDADDVTVNFYEQPVANAGNGGDECDLTFSLNAVPSVGTGTWTYAGPGTATFAPDANDPAATATVTAYGTYTFTWTEVNGTCTDADDVTVNFYEQPVANAGNGGDECDLTFSLNAVPSVGTGTWTYAGPGTATFAPDANDPAATATVTAYGTYTFTWTEVNGTCTDADDVTVNFYEQPVANAGNGGDECDLTFSLNAVPSVGTGTWTYAGPGTATFAPDANDPAATATVTAYGTYTFTWTEVNGTCTDADDVTVNFYEQPVANAGNGGDECDLTFSLNAVPSVGTGTWTYAGPGTATFAPDANDPAATATVTAYGAYTFTWTEVNGICTDADDVTVNFYEQPVANAGNGGDECDLTFSLNAVPSVGTGTWTYAGPGTATFAPDANDPAATATVTAYGTYTFTWTEVNGICTDADDVTVNFYEQPVANAGNGGDECDLTFSLNAVPSVGTGTWTYAGPGTATFAPDANDPDATATVTAYGAYTFTWTEVNGTCTDADDVTVNFYEQSVANAGNGGDECDLTFSLNAVPSVGTGTWTYAARHRDLRA
ncbi:MAG: HYR domain-containing protein [Saprospiraceae bacterium]|nr:HYR domain-containing protein [Saprospiraceae bacterium]